MAVNLGGARGVTGVAYFITGYEHSIKLSVLFPFLWQGPGFQGLQLIRTYLSPLQLVLCRVTSIEHLPEYHYSADYMFSSFGSLSSFIVILITEF